MVENRYADLEKKYKGVEIPKPDCWYVQEILSLFSCLFSYYSHKTLLNITSLQDDNKECIGIQSNPGATYNQHVKLNQL